MHHKDYKKVLHVHHSFERNLQNAKDAGFMSRWYVKDGFIHDMALQRTYNPRDCSLYQYHNQDHSLKHSIILLIITNDGQRGFIANEDEKNENKELLALALSLKSVLQKIK